MYVVTGASDGLGLAIVTLLAAQHKKVVGLSRTKPKVKAVQYIPCDLTNEMSINGAAEELTKSEEPLTALINCAGVFSEEPAEAITGRELARTYTTNIIGPIILVSRLMERIKKDGTDIVNVSSTAGTKGNPRQAGYGSSKWAMRGFSQNLQTELKDTPCRVISFVPGGMSTEFFKKFRTETAPDNQNWMDTSQVAEFMLRILELPKNMEVTEVILNRR